MFGGMALSVHLLVYAGLSLFIINGPYVYMVVRVVYAYNLTLSHVLQNGLTHTDASANAWTDSSPLVVDWTAPDPAVGSIQFL